MQGNKQEVVSCSHCKSGRKACKDGKCSSHFRIYCHTGEKPNTVLILLNAQGTLQYTKNGAREGEVMGRVPLLRALLFP